MNGLRVKKDRVTRGQVCGQRLSQMTQINRLDRTLSLTTHRDLKVVELTELVDG